MKKEEINFESFETFYASKEESNCPLIPSVIESGKEIEKQKKDLDIIISVRYGGRMLTNTASENFEDITRKEFLEIVDYDPVKKVLLTIGKETPQKETPIHWMIQHARNDIHIIVQIKSLDNFDKYDFPTIEKSDNVLETVKNILRKLRDDNIIKIKKHGLIFTGKSLESVKDEVLKTILKKDRGGRKKNED